MSTSLFIERRPINWAEKTNGLWDFDGVKYDYSDAFYEACHTAKALAISTLFPDMGYAKALELSYISFLQLHDPFAAYIPFAEEHGETTESFREKIHVAYHVKKLDTLRKDMPEVLAPQHDNIAALKKLDGTINHAIITHSSIDEWCNPASKSMGLFPFFQHIFGYKEFGYENKAESPRAVTTALDALKARPEHSFFVEDTAANLVMAKAAYPELTTVLKLDYNAPPVDRVALSHIDVIIRKPFDLLNHLVQIHGLEHTPELNQTRYQKTPWTPQTPPQKQIPLLRPVP